MSAVQTEGERAAQVFAVALHVLIQLSPELVGKMIDARRLDEEESRQARVFELWTKVEPKAKRAASPPRPGRKSTN